MAISPLAITALIFGLLSLLSLVFTLFLAAAVVGLLAGLLAIVKIRQSNGTQSGTIAAIAGILLSLVVGGGVLARTVRSWSREREATRKCAEAIETLGNEVKAGNYDRAYDNLMTEAFRSKFDRAFFRARFQEVQAFKEVGHLEWYRLNDLPIIFDSIVDSDAKQGKTYALAKFANQPESREPFVLNNVEGTWKIDALPRFFKLKKQGKGKDKEKEE